MRIQVGRIINVENDVNLAELTPVDRVVCSIISAYHNTKLYKRRFAESEEKKEEQKRKIREALTDNLLTIVYAQLNSNQLLKDKGDTCTGILIKIPPKFTPYLTIVLDSHEFDAYNTHIIPPSKLLLKFADPPYMLYVSNKGG